MPDPNAPSTTDELSSLWRQDVEIDARVRAVLRAVEEGDSVAAQRSAAELEAFIHTHLEREEDIYFPAAAALSPENAYALRSIRLAHLGIREDLSQLRRTLERGHIEAGRTQLKAFLESFRAHESAEDKVIEALGAARET